MSISHLYAETLSLSCSIWLKYFYIFAAMTQAMRTRKTRRTFIPSGTWWLPKRPPGKWNGNSKLIYALSFFFFVDSLQLPWENKNLYFPKENIIVHCSNYEKKYHKRGWWPPLLSSDDPEDHTFFPGDLRVVVVGSPLPKHKKKWGKQHILLQPKKVRTGSVIVVSK